MAGTTIRLAALVAGAALTLTGCGGGTGTAGDGTGKAKGGSGTTATPAAKVKLTRAPFCDKISLTDVAATFGTPKVKVYRELKPGQKYKPYTGAPPEVAKNWSCDLGTNNAKPGYEHYAYISGQPFTQAAYETEVKTRVERSKADTKASCEKTESDVLVPHGVKLTCSRKEVNTKSSFSSGYASVNYYAFVDNAMIGCGAYSNVDTRLPKVVTASEKLCHDFFETVSD